MSPLRPFDLIGTMEAFGLVVVPVSVPAAMAVVRAVCDYAGFDEGTESMLRSVALHARHGGQKHLAGVLSDVAEPIRAYRWQWELEGPR